MFRKQYKFTCVMCGHEWYVTPKELKQSKKLKKEIDLMQSTFNMTKASRLGIPTRKVQGQAAVLSEMKQTYYDPTRCTCCGSARTARTKA